MRRAARARLFDDPARVGRSRRAAARSAKAAERAAARAAGRRRRRAGRGRRRLRRGWAALPGRARRRRRGRRGPGRPQVDGGRLGGEERQPVARFEQDARRDRLEQVQRLPVGHLLGRRRGPAPRPASPAWLRSWVPDAREGVAAEGGRVCRHHGQPRHGVVVPGRAHAVGDRRRARPRRGRTRPRPRCARAGSGEGGAEAGAHAPAPRARSPTTVVRSDSPRARPASLISCSAFRALRSRPAPSSWSARAVAGRGLLVDHESPLVADRGEELRTGHRHLRRQRADQGREQVGAGGEVAVRRRCRRACRRTPAARRKPSSAPRS